MSLPHLKVLLVHGMPKNEPKEETVLVFVVAVCGQKQI